MKKTFPDRSEKGFFLFIPVIYIPFPLHLVCKRISIRASNKQYVIVKFMYFYFCLLNCVAKVKSVFRICKFY